MPKNISAATLMVLSACIIWGAQPMFVTFVVREFDPIPLVSIRYFTVGVVLLAALAYSGEKLLPPRKAWLPLFLMGVLSVGGNNVAQFTGLQYSTVANLTIIASLTPAVTALLSLVLLHERLHKLQWLGIAASIIGAVYLISKGSLSTIINLNFNFGDILFCVSMVAWAFYTILVAQVSKYVSAYSAVAWAGLLGSLTTAAYSILTGQFALPYDLSALAWGSYFYVIFIGSLVGMLFWNKGIRVIGPSQAAVFMNLMPLVGIICGIAFLDESFYTSEAVGGALIIAGVYLTTQYRLLAYKLARYLVKRRRQKSLNDCYAFKLRADARHFINHHRKVCQHCHANEQAYRLGTFDLYLRHLGHSTYVRQIRRQGNVAHTYGQHSLHYRSPDAVCHACLARRKAAATTQDLAGFIYHGHPWRLHQ